MYWQDRFDSLSDEQKRFAVSIVVQQENEYTTFTDTAYKLLADTTLYTSIENMRDVYCIIRQMILELAKKALK